MRTTLTLDDDVAAQLERLRKQRGEGFKELVNAALRRGMRDMTSRGKQQTPFRTRSVTLGRVYVNADNVAESLACAETEPFA